LYRKFARRALTNTNFYIVDNQADVESQHIYYPRDCGLDPQRVIRVICVLSRQPQRIFSFALSRFRAFALSRIRAFAHSRFRAFALSRFRAFALSRFRAFARRAAAARD